MHRIGRYHRAITCISVEDTLHARNAVCARIQRSNFEILRTDCLAAEWSDQVTNRYELACWDDIAPAAKLVTIGERSTLAGVLDLVRQRQLKKVVD